MTVFVFWRLSVVSSSDSGFFKRREQWSNSRLHTRADMLQKCWLILSATQTCHLSTWGTVRSCLKTTRSSRRRREVTKVCCVVSPSILDPSLHHDVYVGASVGVTQEKDPHEGFIFFVQVVLRSLPYFSAQERFSGPFASSTMESNFVYSRHRRSPLLCMM